MTTIERSVVQGPPSRRNLSVKLSDVSCVALACGLFSLVGCGLGAPNVSVAVPTGSVAHPSFSLSGTVFGGQQPVVGAHVYVMAVTGSGGGSNSGGGLPSTSLLNAAQAGNLDSVGAYTLTDAGGGFALAGDYACPSASAQVYLYVLGGNPGAGTNPAAGFLAAVGTCGSIGSNTKVAVNELSTVAAAYALAGFATSATDMSVGSSALAQQGLQNAFLNAQQLVGMANGDALTVTPSGTGVPDTKKIYTLGNILAACVNSTGTNGVCATLFRNALSGGATGTMPTDTATAAINIARHPFVSTVVIRNLVNVQPPQPPYVGLVGYPADFSIGIRYTGGGLNAPQAVAIDASGDAFVTNTGGSVTEFTSTGVVSSGGSASATNTEALDGAQNAWYATGTSGVVEQSSGGAMVSPTNGFTGGQLNTPTAVALDGSGDVWATNTSANSVDSVTELIGAAVPVATPIGASVNGTPAPGVNPTQPATPETLAQATVIHQVQLDGSLYGHNMAVNDCLAYVTLQNGSATGKLVVVNVCATDGNNQPQPAIVSSTAASYAYTNGIAVNGGNLYITYGWATNPFEVWSTGAGGTAPALQGCVPLFSDAGYTTCGQAPVGGNTGSLYGANPYVLGKYAYVPQNSDDAGQAVQIIDPSVPTAPVRLNAMGGVGISSGTDANGGIVSGLWAPGAGNILYLGTNANTTGQSVTMTAYDAGQNATSPVKLGTLNLPAGYLIQGMGAQGTTVVANLWNATAGSAQILVANFANPNSPTMTAIAPTSGCVPGAGNFVAMQNGYAFFGCGSPGTLQTGIEVVQVSNPAAPVLLGQIATSLKRVNFIVPVGRYLFAVDGSSATNGGSFDTVDTGSLFVP
jgi:hypothetical protein